MKDQPLRTVDDVIAEIKGMSIEEIASEPWEGPHLITVDELRAAGALDVPPAWRKSLGAGSDLFEAGDDGTLPLFAAPSSADSNDIPPVAETER